MKSTFKFFTGVFMLSIVLYSCTSEIEEPQELSALEQELKLENQGLLEVENTTYIFKTSGETSKFNLNSSEFDYKFADELQYEVHKSSSKHAGEEVTVTNPETNESIRFSHLVDLKNGSFQFDAEASNGQKFFSLVYTPASASGKWHNEGFEPNSPLVDAVIELSSDEVTGRCRAAIEICSRSGGRAFVNMHRGTTWFGAAETCSVQCVQ